MFPHNAPIREIGSSTSRQKVKLFQPICPPFMISTFIISTLFIECDMGRIIAFHIFYLLIFMFSYYFSLYFHCVPLYIFILLLFIFSIYWMQYQQDCCHCLILKQKIACNLISYFFIIIFCVFIVLLITFSFYCSLYFQFIGCNIDKIVAIV